MTIRRIRIWRAEIDDRPGALAMVLEPLATAKADLDVVMGYKLPGQRDRAVVEVWPISGPRLSEAAEGAGLTPSPTPTVLVTGPNRRGLAHAVARALGDAGVTLSFLVAQVVGGHYSGVFGFVTDEDADLAATVIRRAAGA